MRAYLEVYLRDVVENQGKLFDYVAQNFPDKDTGDFINAYMMSKTRKCINESQAYVITMDARELWDYFTKNEQYSMKLGRCIEGSIPDWIGEFYAYYQWYYALPSSEILAKIEAMIVLYRSITIGNSVSVLSTGMKSEGKNHPWKRFFIGRDEIRGEESSLEEIFYR